MYPRVNIYRNKLRENASILQEAFRDRGIELVAVTKVFGADAKIIEAYHEGGVRHFADARIQNLERIDPKYGDRMLLRIPMLSELARVVRSSERSLQSEWVTIKALNEEARRQGRKHKILLMIDLGDLREGVYAEEELFDIAGKIKNLDAIEWEGTGTNLTCYGGVLPTKKNLDRLVALTRELRSLTGFALPVISAGNSSSLYLIENREHPEWNQLRIGEALAVGTESAYGQRFMNLHTDAFVFEAEVIESRMKPSLPVGEIGKNAFGETPVFENRGEHSRVIVGVGRQDADAADLSPEINGSEILGASSDHMIIDPGPQVENKIVVGDTLTFQMNYRSVLRVFTSEYVARNYIDS